MTKSRYHYSKSFAVISFWPAFSVGIKDGFNPCSLVSILLFYMLLSRVGHTRKHIWVAGSFFILASLIVTFLSVLGGYDEALNFPGVSKGIRIIYVVLGGILSVKGIEHFLDWMRFKQGKDTQRFILKLPVFARQLEGVKKPNIFFLIFSSAFYGWFATLLGLIYPKNEYVFILFSHMMAGENKRFALASLGFYSLFFILPLVGVWWMVMRMKGNEKSDNFVSKLKIVSSAIFLSVGLGILYLNLCLGNLI